MVCFIYSLSLQYLIGAGNDLYFLSGFLPPMMFPHPMMAPPMWPPPHPPQQPQGIGVINLPRSYLMLDWFHADEATDNTTTASASSDSQEEESTGVSPQSSTDGGTPHPSQSQFPMGFPPGFPFLPPPPMGFMPPPPGFGTGPISKRDAIVLGSGWNANTIYPSQQVKACNLWPLSSCNS